MHFSPPLKKKQLFTLFFLQFGRNNTGYVYFQNEFGEYTTHYK